MREALIRIGSDYSEVAGSSKIAVLFIISIVALILLNEIESDKEKRRRINPAVFLSSIWSGIAYTGVRILAGKSKLEKACGLLIGLVAISLSGGFIISKEAFELSAYSSLSIPLIVLSIVFALVYFVIYYLVSRELFEERFDRVLFMGYIVLLMLNAFYSEKALAFSCLLSPISIGSIILHGILPLILWIYLKYEEQIKNAFEYDDSETDENTEIPEEWDMKKHKILNIRNMAIAFIVFIAAFAGVVFVLNNKINSLYDATVTLENAANTKISLYELEGEDGSVVMSVMVSPEGSVTVIDGQDKTNGTKAYELISKYTDKVDKWYLYSDHSGDKGAYDFCVEQGMKVDKTYIISGIEEID